MLYLTNLGHLCTPAAERLLTRFSANQHRDPKRALARRRAHRNHVPLLLAATRRRRLRRRRPKHLHQQPDQTRLGPHRPRPALHHGHRRDRAAAARPRVRPAGRARRLQRRPRQGVPGRHGHGVLFDYRFCVRRVEERQDGEFGCQGAGAAARAAKGYRVGGAAGCECARRGDAAEERHGRVEGKWG